MKRFLCIVMLLVMTLSLTACDGGNFKILFDGFLSIIPLDGESSDVIDVELLPDSEGGSIGFDIDISTEDDLIDSSSDINTSSNSSVTSKPSSGTTAQTSKPSSGSTAQTDGKMTISIACWWNPLPTKYSSTQEDRIIYQQMEDAKKKYGVTFNEIVVQQTDIRKNYDAALMSGTIWADIMYMRAEQAGDYAENGKLLDLTDLFNFDQPEYNQNIRQRFTKGGKTYAFTYYMDDLDSAIVFNKSIFDRKGVEYPYSLVHQKKWTWDKFVETVKAVTVKDSYNNTQVYGFYGNPENWDQFMYTAINKEMVSVTGSGNYVSNAQDAEVVAFLKKYQELMTMSGYVYLPPSDAVWNDGMAKFISGSVAMADFSMSGGPNSLKSMADDWGVVPKPTMREGQDWKFQNETQNVQVMPAALNRQRAAKIASIYEEIYTLPYTDEERQTARRNNLEEKLRDKESVNIVYEFSTSYPIIYKGSTMMNDDNYWSVVISPMKNAMRGATTVEKTINSFAYRLQEMCLRANSK